MAEDKTEHVERHKSTNFVWLLGGMAIIGGFLFGYDTGVVSAALLWVPDALNLDYLWTQLVVSVTVGACAISSMAGGPANDHFGRRYMILFSSALFTVGAILLAASVSGTMLLLSRIIIGLAVGLSSMTVPPYLAEAAPTEIRGFLVTGFQLSVTVGFFLASVIGAAFSYIDPLRVGWRLMFGVAGVPAVIQFIGFLFLPESPRWLLMKGREEEARQILNRIYGAGREKDVNNEIASINENVAAEAELNPSNELVIIRMLKTPPVRKALFIGCSLQAFQQLSGVNTLMFYTASVISMSGVRDKIQAIWISCIVTGVNVAFTFVPIFLVEKWGRRRLLLLSQIGVMLSLLLLGGGFLLINQSAPTISNKFSGANVSASILADLNRCASHSNCDNCVTMETCGYCYNPTSSNGSINSGIGAGLCLPSQLGVSDVAEIGPCSNRGAINATGELIWAWNYCPTSYAWLPIIAMVCFLSCFSTGLAPMPWVINSEIYPNWARSTGVAASTASNWIANVIVSQTFLSLTENLTKFGTFFLFFGITLVSFVIFYAYVPETMGIPVEEIEKLFTSDKSSSPSAKSNKIQPAHSNQTKLAIFHIQSNRLSSI